MSVLPMGKVVLPAVTAVAVLVLGGAWAARLPPAFPVVELVLLGEPEPTLDLHALADSRLTRRSGKLSPVITAGTAFSRPRNSLSSATTRRSSG